MPDVPDRPDPDPEDPAPDRRRDLLRLFPEAGAEGGGIDFERLRAALGEAEAPRERFGLDWPGRAACFRALRAPAAGTLRPCPEESLDWDRTGNLVLEGDNLEVLKLLQPGYRGRIKLVCIDPPYNTGNDFIYPDDYREPLRAYLACTGQGDAQGRPYGTDPDTGGRLHSRWLSMMYPRLHLARQLLAGNGVICVSIDDHELASLRVIMNEIFGEENFLATVVVQSNKRGQTYRAIAKSHEYLVIYAREPGVALAELEKEEGALPYRDAEGPFDLWELRNRNPRFGRRNRPNLFFPIYAGAAGADGLAPVALERSPDFPVEVLPRNSAGVDGCWRWSRERIRRALPAGSGAALVARQKRGGGWNIYEKARKGTTKAKSIWTETGVISEQGTVELGRLGLAGCFDHPKPLALVRKCLRLASGDGDLVLDCFAGSGTLAQAVLEQNQADGLERRFILVQLPEPTRTRGGDGAWVETPAWRAGFATLADVAKERIRRAAAALDAAGGAAAPVRADRGFRVFKLAAPAFRAWDPAAVADLASLRRELARARDPIAPDRSRADLLYEILLRRGLPLTAPVSVLRLAGREVFAVAGAALLACLEPELDLAVVEAMAEAGPEWVVCLDRAFGGDDQLKANAARIVQARGAARFLAV